MTVHAPNSTPRRRTNPIVRTLAAAGLILAFVLLASYIRPSDTTADPTLRSVPDDGAASLGWLESADYRVEIFLTSEGTRYDVYDAIGDPIVFRATREEMYRIDPALDPDAMVGQSPIGIVTDDDDF